MWSFLATAMAMAGNDTTPTPPESHKPTVTHADRRAEIMAGDLPEQLYPFRTRRNGTIGSTRFYTPEGEVYRMAELVQILEISDDPSVRSPFRKYKSANNALLGVGGTVLAVEIVLIPIGFGLLDAVVLVGADLGAAAVFGPKASRELTNALDAYNAHAPSEEGSGLVSLESGSR